MSKFFGFDENMSNAIAKITTPKLALMSGLVAPEKEFITGSGSSITIKAGILIAVGDSVFKTAQTTLTAANLDSGNSFTVGKDYCIYICDPTGGDDTDFTGEVYLSPSIPHILPDTQLLHQERLVVSTTARFVA